MDDTATAERDRVAPMRGLAPGLLIATPGLREPHFAHAVVLLVEHGPFGSYGMVINRRAPIDLGSLLDATDIPHRGVLTRTVWLGGPVQPQSGLMLYRQEPGLPAYEPLADILPGVRMSSSMDLLRDVALGQGPNQYALYLGRASWDAGQLESQIASGIWLPAEADPALLFEFEGEDCWRLALASIGATPSSVARNVAMA